MRMSHASHSPTALRASRAFLPGAGFLIVGTASLLLWGMIAGVVAIV